MLEAYEPEELSDLEIYPVCISMVVYRADNLLKVT